MNDKMIEAMSQFEIQACAQASGPDDTVRCRARARPAQCASSAVSLDTECNTLTGAIAIYW